MLRERSAEMEIRREGLSCSSLCMKTKQCRATWCMIKHASGHVEGGPLLGHTPNGPWLACLGLLLGLDLGLNLDKVGLKIKSNKIGLGSGPNKKN